MATLQKIEVQILNAFVDNGKGGNPAGVVLHADNLTHDQKLAVAAKVGLSETAFVSQSKTADFKLDFYTPTRQIAHCGHATIATFSYLSQLGMIKKLHSSKETIDGNRAILIEGDLAFMEQKPPKYSDIDAKKVLKSLGLSEKDVLQNAPICPNTRSQ
jgi:PhzF family phenazine biosynthesis protein